MKEELIKELVANSKITNRLNVQLKQKIELMEKEINQYKLEIVDLQRQTQQVASSSGKTSDLELKKKLEHAQNRIMELEANRNKVNLEKKLSDLELAYGKLKQQNDLLQKRIKDDTDKKMRLEKDFEKEQQRLKELETKSEKQQQILKKKTEDLAQAQRRLRSASQSGPSMSDNEQQKHWVEQEMEKILQEKRQIELFKDELIKREELIKKKECLIREKDKLEDKKSKNLQESHMSLIKQRKHLDEKLNNGAELTSQEERRLIEIDEAIEAIEIAIEYENDSIREKQIKLKDSVYFENPNQVQNIKIKIKIFFLITFILY